MKRQKFLLNEISNLLIKLRDSNVLNFTFKPFQESEIGSFLNDVINSVENRKIRQLLTNNENFLHYIHQHTLALVLKKLINDIFSKVLKTADESKKSFLVKLYTQKLLRMHNNFSNDYKIFSIKSLERTKKQNQEDSEINSFVNLTSDDIFYFDIVNLFENVFHEMIHHVFDKTIFLSKFYPEVVYRKMSKYDFDEQTFENMIDFLERDLEKSVTLKSIIVELFKEIEKIDFRSQNEFKEYFLNFFIRKYLSENTKRTITREFYQKFYNVLKYFLKTDSEFNSILFKVFQNFKNKRDRVYYKKYFEEIFEYLDKKIRMISALGKEEIEKLIQLGLIYKDFNENFKNKYKTAFLLNIKKLRVKDENK